MSSLHFGGGKVYSVLMKALIVDDSRTMRAVLKRIMEEHSFEIAEAGNGVQALETLSRHGPFKVALVDWNMPDLNGYEFVKQVRSREEFRDLCLIMVTAETEKEHVIQALDAGVNEYVMKPFTPEVIIEKLVMLGIIPPPAPKS